jgi:signal transduction histidine kinase
MGCVCKYEWKVAPDVQLSVTKKMNLFRIIQEGMQNVIKHSKASQVILSALSSKTHIVITLEDNGTGKVEKNQIPNSKAAKRMVLGRGLGLKSMEYRAHQIDAEYSWKSESGKGTTIKLKVPLEERTQ